MTASPSALAAPLPGATTAAAPSAAAAVPPTLRQLVEDGAYLVLLLRNGDEPGDPETFKYRVDQFFEDFEKRAAGHGYAAETIRDAKYALSAYLDETILTSKAAIRDEWELYPLQLRYFGEHLAGETFFTRLEELRLQPDRNVAVIEVFHLCLLLGFQGKYKFEGAEKLRYLATSLGQEISRIRGDRSSFSPSAALPDEIQQVVTYELPMWVFVALALVIALAGYFGYQYLLGQRVDELIEAVRRVTSG